MASATDLIFYPPFLARISNEELEFELAEPWYRSLPISCITALDVSIDGQKVAPEQIRITIAGVTRTIPQCADAWEEFWFIQDRATIHVAGVGTDKNVRIHAHLGLRIPYLMVGPTTALPHHAVQEETFEVVL